MAEKISVYVDEKLHCVLKAAAAQRGKSLSQYMIDAALQTLYTPDRKALGAAMDLVRESQEEYFSRDEILEMRKGGRRY
jgi:hypothetical protein